MQAFQNPFTRHVLSTYQRLHRRYDLDGESKCIAGALRPIYCIRDPDAAVEQSLANQNKNSSSSELVEGNAEEEPYWMQHWPSALSLDAELDRLLAEFNLGPLHTTRTLELGCGGGLLSLSLALRHCKVLATDYSRDALLLTKLNGYANKLDIQTRLLDWRRCSLQPFDLVIAADVAYDRSVFPALNNCLNQSIAASGTAILAEPFRSMGDDFIDFLLHQGWFVQIRESAVIDGRVATKKCRFIVVRHS